MTYEKSAYLDHMAIFVKDIKWTITFFKEVFNMPVSRAAGDAENPSQVWLVGGLQIVSAPDFASDEGRSAHLGINVDDLDACLAAAYERGVRELPNGHNWFELPDGLQIEVMPTSGEKIQWYFSSPKK